MDTTSTTKPKDHTHTPSSLADSGYISQPLDSMEISSSSSHLKTSSISSSGYYSRLDSTDFTENPILEEGEESSSQTTPPSLTHPWQYYVTPTSPTSEATPLHLAVLSKDTHLVSKILSLLPHPSVVNVQTDVSRETALHLAVLTNQVELVRLLVVGGAAVGVKDCNGDSPVHLACRWGFGGVLESLVRAVGADEATNPQIQPARINEALLDKNSEGLTPLHLATLSFHPSLPSPTPLHTLVFLSTPISSQDGRAGRTPLHLAIEKKDLAALHLLLQYATKSELEIENYSGMTAYTLASCNCLRPFCQALQNVGAVCVDYFSEQESDDDEGEE